MKEHLPTLFAAMALVFGIVTVCQAQDARPSIEILFPTSEQTVHMGEEAVIKWQVHNPPTPQDHWKVYVFLSGCHEAMGNAQIYSGPLGETPGQINWTPDPWFLKFPDMRWDVLVQLYDETSGEDEALLYTQTCHGGFGGDWLVESFGNGPMVRIEP